MQAQIAESRSRPASFSPASHSPTSLSPAAGGRGRLGEAIQVGLQVVGEGGGEAGGQVGDDAAE